MRADDWVRTSMICFTRAAPFYVEPRRLGCRISSPTRNRTRNFWLEARDDVRFTIEPLKTSGRRGSRTLITRRWHALAVRPGKPYPAAFRNQIESGPEGNRTLLTDLARISRPLGTCQPICFYSEVRPGIEPGLRPYHRRVLPQHLQTVHFSDHGWNRTIGLLLVTQAS